MTRHSSRAALRAREVRNALIQVRKRLRRTVPTAYVHSSAHVSRDIALSDYVFIGPDCRVDAGVSIGRYTMLAARVAVRGADHVWDRPGVPSQFAGRPEQPSTNIGADVWVGHGALIMRGVTIGDGAIIGAQSVVTRDVDPFSIVAGVPARVVASRFPDPADRRRHEAMLAGELVAPAFAEPLESISSEHRVTQ